MSSFDAKKKDCHDVWNSFMVDGARLTDNDIPYCPTTMTELPPRLITYDQAVHSTDYEAGIVFFRNDYRFDGIKGGIWASPHRCLQVVSRFRGGVLTPDFGMNQDLPLPWKIFNTYRKQAYGWYFVRNGLKVCCTLRWGNEETWSFCFDGVIPGTMVAVSTWGCIEDRKNRQLFKNGFDYMMKLLEPPTVIVYGLCPDDIFGKYSRRGIRIAAYESATDPGRKEAWNV